MVLVLDLQGSLGGLVLLDPPGPLRHENQDVLGSTQVQDEAVGQVHRGRVQRDLKMDSLTHFWCPRDNVDSALACYAGGRGLIPAVGSKLSIEMFFSNLSIGIRKHIIGPRHVEMVF